MRYTDAEKQKITENLDKIVEYIKTEICPNLRETIVVDFTAKDVICIWNNANGNPEITGRCGANLTINFNHENVNGLYYNSSSVYTLDSVAILRYAIDLILNWKFIKEELIDNMTTQQSIINTINNFEV